MSTTLYDNFAYTFSNSRKNMKWQEIDYFLDFLEGDKSYFNFLQQEKGIKILDIGCGNGRLLGILQEKGIKFESYLGIDNSKELLNEAKRIYNIDSDKGNICFLERDMLKLNLIIGCEFDVIFFIASFHHIEDIDNRFLTLLFADRLLRENGMIFMTNWALKSDLNREKYKNFEIPDSTNKFGSSDFGIKIGEFNRFYHSFSLEELKYLFKKVGFEIVENREFEGGKNIISVLRKKLINICIYNGTQTN